MLCEPDGLLISPGPGRPEAAGVSSALIAAFAGVVPVLGVCLGHQCIGEVFGGRIVRTGVMHGKTSSIAHDGQGVFAGCRIRWWPPATTRWWWTPAAVPPDLEVSRLGRGRDDHGPAAPHLWRSRASSSIPSRS